MVPVAERWMLGQEVRLVGVRLEQRVDDRLIHTKTQDVFLLALRVQVNDISLLSRFERDWIVVKLISVGSIVYQGVY